MNTSIRISIIGLAVLMLPSVSWAAGAALMLTLDKGAVTVGERVTATILVSSPSQAMNAVSGTLTIPSQLSLESLNTSGSSVNFWTQEPKLGSNRISFEGVLMNPGYQGVGTKIFTATFTAKTTGTGTFSFGDGAVLANDGRGTNIISSLKSTRLTVRAWDSAPIAHTNQILTPLIADGAVPVITDYSASLDAKSAVHLIGRGTPGARTEITFRQTSLRSLGERFISFLQNKKYRLDAVIVQNDPDTGVFTYESPSNVIAGAYNATPALVDAADDTKKEGASVEFFVHDSRVVHILIVAINVLALLVPIVSLIVLIYFIPWYSRRRMQILKERFNLEEEKIKLDEHQITRKERRIDEH